MDTMTGPDKTGAQAPPPDTIVRAVRLMWVGAALAVLLGLVGGANEVHRPVVAAISVASGVVVGGIWWLVARACQRGRGTGRVVGAVFFALSTLGMVQSLSGELHVETAALVIDILSWVVGLGAMVLLWQRDSGVFFDSRRTFPR
ncbi:hypothetical protein [Catenulispora acidiphila]|nr:hypothetical protein [Catenulispora acidiphila]